MTTIDPSADVVTLINVFTVAPENQRRLLDVLTEATTSVVAAMPGFVSANFHRSLDGSRVTNYAQWRSREDMEAMLAHTGRPRTTCGRAAAIAIAFEPHLYEVVVSLPARSQRPRSAGASAS
jgi:quinol monooxygenase YgiN